MLSRNIFNNKKEKDEKNQQSTKKKNSNELKNGRAHARMRQLLGMSRGRSARAHFASGHDNISCYKKKL